METKVPKIESFDELVDNLRVIFDSNDIDVDFVQNLLLSYKSNPIEWKKYAHFDKHKYTRNLVDKGNGKYNLMLVCWSEGQGSSIHDHSDAHCFMKMLSGSLHEIRYEWPDSTDGKSSSTEPNNNFEQTVEMKVKDENHMKTNEVAYINDSIGLHRVENRSHTYPAVSLHIYIPPYSQCLAFDQRTGRRNKIKVTFYSKYGLRAPFKVSKPIHNCDQNSKNCVNSDKELVEFDRQE